MEEQITTDLRFSIIPHWLLATNVSNTGLRLYAVLAKFADAETGQAFPGRTRLSKELDCSLKTVDRAVAELIELGAIRKVQRVKDGYYQSSLYTVVRIDPASRVTPPRDIDDATPRHERRDPVSSVTHRTITTEQEPKNKNHLTKAKPKNADEYEPSEAIRADFETRYPGLRLDVELEKFRDHHMAAGSSFKDWDRAMRKWLRQASEWSKEARAERARLTADEEWEKYKRENGLD